MLFDIKDDEIHRIRDIFATFDEDGSGSITINELGDVYNALGHDFSENELLEMMKTITGEITSYSSCVTEPKMDIDLLLLK